MTGCMRVTNGQDGNSRFEAGSSPTGRRVV